MPVSATVRPNSLLRCFSVRIWLHSPSPLSQTCLHPCKVSTPACTWWVSWKGNTCCFANIGRHSSESFMSLWTPYITGTKCNLLKPLKFQGARGAGMLLSSVYTQMFGYSPLQNKMYGNIIRYDEPQKLRGGGGCNPPCLHPCFISMHFLEDSM